MPAKLPWTDEDDERLLKLLGTPGYTVRRAAETMEVSRSFLQRRAVRLISAARAKYKLRDEQGGAPLPQFHPLAALPPLRLPGA